jgi:tripartite-type tricarboxylate transporter receptor subunit TctC
MTRPAWIAVFACAASALAPAALAQAYPSRPIRLIVPTAAGGAADTVARVVAQKISENWAQQVVVDDRPGANGNIGAELLARATPDGYTLMMGTIGVLAINPLIYRKVGYDPLRDFAPVAQLVSFANVLVVHPGVAAKTVPELIALAKAKPGALQYGSPGSGGSPHMCMVVFARMAGIDVVHIPYKGAAPALNDLIGGQIPMAFSDAIATLPHVAAGRLRALAVSGSTRLPVAPEIPTVAEAGLPGYSVSSYLGVVAPARTPAALVKQLNSELGRIVATPDVSGRLAKMGAVVTTGSPEDFQAHLRAEKAKWSKVVSEAGIRAD